jgi:NADH-quinone oxidoreductase subunit G
MIVPVYRIFGSDELSSDSPSIAQKIEKPFVLMNQKDADVISLKEGDSVQLEISKVRLTLKVKIENSLQNGMAGLSVNLPGMPFIDIPGTGKFHKL